MYIVLVGVLLSLMTVIFDYIEWLDFIVFYIVILILLKDKYIRYVNPHLVTVPKTFSLIHSYIILSLKREKVS